VPIGYLPPEGIRYEVIEELFIPEHSPYYSVEEAPANVKGINHIKSNVEKQAGYTDALKTLEAISFIITGNADQLNKPTAGNTPTGMQKATSYVTKHFLWTSWQEAVYNPEGYIRVSANYGDKPVANIRVRVARYFTFYETRTDANGRFYFNNQFGQDAIFPNIEYFVYFDGQNGSNFWRLCDYLDASTPLWTTGISLGVHNPDRYDQTFTPTSDYWGKCVQLCAINNYMDIARRDGISLPAGNLNIISINNPEYTKHDDLLKNNIAGGGNPDMVLRYQNTYNDYFKIMANTWHKFTNASQVSRMISLFGLNWTSGNWNAVQDQLTSDDSDGLNDCFCITHKPGGDCSQQIALSEGWANYRAGELYRQYFIISGFNSPLIND
jgi:hypothetical protein